MKPLGPAFAAAVASNELLRGAPFTWGADGSVSGRENLSSEQQDALDALIDAHDPDALSVPGEISDRQFAHALKNAGIITHAEALAFVQTGTIPTALQSLIAAIPDQAAREDAELLISGATTFQRHHPMTEAMRVGFGWSSQQVDQLWIDAAAL